MPERKPQLIGGLAVEKGLVTRAQLREALEELQRRREAGSQVPLGELLVGMDYITRPQLDYLLEAQGGKRSPRHQIPGFELIKQLGEGSTGGVYLARRLSDDRLVALKILRKSLSRNKAYIDRFLREARLAAQLEHENIVRALGAGEAGGFHYMVMEYVEGRNLYELLPDDGSGLDEPFAVHLALQVTRAMEHAHKHGIVHRDIKPDNILIDGNGVARLTDLGLAKQLDAATRLTQTGMLMGTPDYISPEQARGDTDIDIRSDIYSLGATLYNLLTGRAPFEADNALAILNQHINEQAPWPGDVNPDLSVACCTLIEKMMAKDPGDRHQSPAELAADLVRVSKGKYPAEQLPERRGSSVGRAGTVAVLPRRGHPLPWPRRGVDLETREVPAITTTRTVRPVSGGGWRAFLLMGISAVGLLVLGFLLGINAATQGRGRAAGSTPASPWGDPSIVGHLLYRRASDYWERNPDRYAEAIARFELVRSAAPGTDWEARARKAIAAIRAAQQGGR